MTTAAAHSHHSRRSIRRKFVRRALVCATPGSPLFLARRSRTSHPWASTSWRKPPCFQTSGALRGPPILPIRSCKKPARAVFVPTLRIRRNVLKYMPFARSPSITMLGIRAILYQRDARVLFWNRPRRRLRFKDALIPRKLACVCRSVIHPVLALIIHLTSTHKDHIIRTVSRQFTLRPPRVSLLGGIPLLPVGCSQISHHNP
jgi:hypothetical protein